MIGILSSRLVFLQRFSTYCTLSHPAANLTSSARLTADYKGVAMKMLLMSTPRDIARRRLYSPLVLLCTIGAMLLLQVAPPVAAVQASNLESPITTSDQPDFGPNVYIFDP